MRIVLLGAAGFIGTNLSIRLMKLPENELVLVDEKIEYFRDAVNCGKSNVSIREHCFNATSGFDELLEGADLVYHLVSTNNPSTSNNNIGQEITDNIVLTINILEACVRQKVKKIVFLSSGGTVYGNTEHYPIAETCSTNPITTYGIQKLTIEKMLYLYNYVYGLDYAVIRLSNPYGPYQRPNGKLGVVTTFIYKALKDETLTVYGDGKNVRDYIYIDDAVEGIISISNAVTKDKIFNLGSGCGTSINEIIEKIKKVIGKPLDVDYVDKRMVDVRVNYLDISNYESHFGKLQLISLEEGIALTSDFMNKELFHK